MLDRARNRPIYEVEKEDVSVPGHDPASASRCSTEPPSGEPLSVAELFERQRSRRAMICLFLAILEMVKLQAVVLAQNEAFGDIVHPAATSGSKKSSPPTRRMAAIEKEYN